ncbi:beta-phosphoglucomutase [Aerosakkonemataceae cyanobacterium BLCC-F154]|uniref:Beta-phosphoglucomutase n=1 Tax=Floridaenema fluviatile BLCC-F154 TaxID=3153640 RepID=A0ABV4YDW2_9CYAN
MQTLSRPPAKPTSANTSDWTVVESQFNPKQLHHQETVFTLGNGYLGTRGTFEEGYLNDLPATFIHGVYDDVPVLHTELVNCPDWLPLVICFAGERFRLDQGEVLDYERRLDLNQGLLQRRVTWRSPAGHIVNLQFERFVSLADRHVLAIRCLITPVNFSGLVEVQASLNGYADNEGVRHWNWLDQGIHNNSAWLRMRSRKTNIEVGMATHLSISCENTLLRTLGCQGYPSVTSCFQAQPGKTVTLEKIVTVFTSRDCQNPAQTAQEKLKDLFYGWESGKGCYEMLRQLHSQAWKREWQICDVVIEGDAKAQLAVRYNLFQILAVAPRDDDTVSIPAKTLSGFAYRGHVFWDTEIFVVPFLTFTKPELARNLLTYRYHTLPGARKKAKEAGFAGAMYAWESAATGEEVTPRWIPIPSGELIRIWCGDRELHINSDIAYAIWQYWQATEDDDWMRDYGAEIVLDTANFWASCVEWNGDRKCYDLKNVIGPDENHELVDNSAFTNSMVQWHLQTAISVLTWLRNNYPDCSKELEQQLNITSTQLANWADIIDRILILHDKKTGLIEEFEGFFNREDINLADYEPRTRSMQAILGIEGANARQVLKQADVLMLMYLLREKFDRQTLQKNWDYYEPRTDHTYGSSLGPAIHAILAADLDKLDEAYRHFMRSALVDLEDVRGNANEGIHAASAGGVWQATIFGFAGVKLTANGPVATPKLPAGWTRLKFRFQWRNSLYEFDLKPTTIKGVIFDLDGVIADTAEYHYLAWQKLADEEGLSFDRQINEALRGLPRRESLLHILGDRHVSEEQFHQMMIRKNHYYLELIQNISPADLLPGVRNLLAELKANNIRIGIGSSSKNAKEVLQRLGIIDFVDAIADGYSVIKPKPAPDTFLHAALQLKINPCECLIIEDAEAGVTAALAGGMSVIGLGPIERVGNAHLVLENLAETSWQTLENQISQVQKSLLPSQVACDVEIEKISILHKENALKKYWVANNISALK